MTTTRDDDGVDTNDIVQLPLRYRATIIFIAVIVFIILVLQISEALKS